ncbi:MAG: hypothetical protein LBB84_00640 [Tannerellaceae bacterium]|jgi:hypothetical protein|nr:hypothetical protein [Tannerellaceae bacterium]
MKTMIRFSAICVLFACCFSLSAQQQKEVPKEMLGKWSYTFEDPQSGQPSTGFCTIKQEEGNTTAVFELDYYGVTTSTPFRPNDNGKFYADMDVQGYPLSLAFAFVDKNLSCNISADSFDFTVQMKRVE